MKDELKVKSDSQLSVFWLATDLDGTLIPIEQDEDQHFQALEQIRRIHLESDQREIVFVTGRHLESVLGVIIEKQLPVPHSIITDVGSSVWKLSNQKVSGEIQWIRDFDYDRLLDAIVGDFSCDHLLHALGDLKQLELQPKEQQGKYKLSYFCKAEHLSELVVSIKGILKKDHLPFSLVSSVDPFNGRGLLDLLPKGVDKLYAIEWFKRTHAREGDSRIVYAGDSGNDLQVFMSETASIIVSNTPSDVKKRVESHFAVKDVRNRKFFASRSSTSGVLEGLKYFGWTDF